MAGSPQTPRAPSAKWALRQIIWFFEVFCFHRSAFSSCLHNGISGNNRLSPRRLPAAAERVWRETGGKMLKEDAVARTCSWLWKLLKNSLSLWMRKRECRICSWEFSLLKNLSHFFLSLHLPLSTLRLQWLQQETRTRTHGTFCYKDRMKTDRPKLNN